ncbi:aminomethyltransferase, mitochondrial [Ceratitis capitata]|uniref:aminomethyltransferase, mitochondrial n=1 Tax=Ceratitis capitata TaxID=7213 RepID=UPI000C6C63C8|nr:aminomethyltransferase, mitochondrial [Ceratitis capitata]
MGEDERRERHYLHDKSVQHQQTKIYLSVGRVGVRPDFGASPVVPSNAGSATKNALLPMNRFKSNGKSVDAEFLTSKDQSLIAIQGPKAVTTLDKLIPKTKTLDQLFFMQTAVLEVAGIKDCRITRCGYTGEDGVEISVPSCYVQHLTEALLNENENIKMAGLGARDSLRLESGLCLYGADITPQTTPVEAGLTWLIARRRRSEADFPGANRILAQLQKGTKDVTHRRIGFTMLGEKKAPPARTGVQIYNQNKCVGYVTSGCLSPSLGKNIAMGYIFEKFCNADILVQFKIRNSFFEAITARMPFVKSQYYLKPKK